MGKKCFRIDGLGAAFDGLIIETLLNDEDEIIDEDALSVVAITNPNVVFGDREPRYEIPDGSMWISAEYLVPVDDPTRREYDSKNPFGEFLYNQEFHADGITTVVGVFELKLSVTVRDQKNEKTLFAGYFDSMWLTDVISNIEMCYQKSEADCIPGKMRCMQGIQTREQSCGS